MSPVDQHLVTSLFGIVKKSNLVGWISKANVHPSTLWGEEKKKSLICKEYRQISKKEAYKSSPLFSTFLLTVLVNAILPFSHRAACNSFEHFSCSVFSLEQLSLWQLVSIALQTLQIRARTLTCILKNQLHQYRSQTQRYNEFLKEKVLGRQRSEMLSRDQIVRILWVFLAASQAFFVGYRAVSGVMLLLAESSRSMQLYPQKKHH